MNIDELKSHALAARRDIVTMIYESGIGHPGGALSIIDILTWIYDQEVDFSCAPRARVVMSKGHAVAAQYAMLHQKAKLSAANLILFDKLTHVYRGTLASNLCPKSMQQPACWARDYPLLLVWRRPKTAGNHSAFSPSLAMAKCTKGKSGRRYNRQAI